MDTPFNLPIGELAEVPLELITPDPEQPRRDFDEDFITNELAPSIARDGVIQPIVVRENPDQPGQFIIIAGENRWRAAGVAGLSTIPAVRREVDGLAKLLIQIKENHQRRGFNALEWAEAFRRMHKDHGLKQAEIEKTLKEGGVGNFGRAYISNTIRLLELPQWAQDLVRHNAITPSHGKYLLPAMASDAVAETMRKRFCDEDWHPTTDKLQWEIYLAFMREHKALTNWMTDFDYRDKCVATGCQKLRKITGNNAAGETFCMDRECWEVLNAAAKAEAADKSHREGGSGDSGGAVPAPRELTFDDEGRVDVELQQLDMLREWRPLEQAGFDITGCCGCQRRHLAIVGSDTESAVKHDACFLVSCFLAKENRSSRALQLARQWLRKVVANNVWGNPVAARALLYWVAAGAPTKTLGDGDELGVEFEYDVMPLHEKNYQSFLLDQGLIHFRDFLLMGNDGGELATAIADTMDDDIVVLVARALQIDAELYRIDNDYLADATEDELTALLDSLDWSEPAALDERRRAEAGGALDQYVIDVRHSIGVPPEMRFALNALLSESPGDE